MSHPVAIVTGSAGYIGSVLCKHLQKKGYYVIGVDNRAGEEISDKYTNHFRWTEFNEIEDVIHTEKDATVFHLAATAQIDESLDPTEQLKNNVSKTLDLLSQLKPSNKLIFASSAAVYGDPGFCPPGGFKEIDSSRPINNYGSSKLMGEHLIDQCYKYLGIKACSFRFFNVAGAWDDVGDHWDSPHIIPSLYRAITTAHVHDFFINGNSYETPDGTAVRDYVHVRDVVNAMQYADWFMGQPMHPDNFHWKYNLGSGKGYSVLQIANAFAATTGCTFDIKYDVPRTGDPATLIANPHEWIKHGAFSYEHTKLEDMIKSQCDYLKDLK